MTFTLSECTRKEDKLLCFLCRPTSDGSKIFDETLT